MPLVYNPHRAYITHVCTICFPPVHQPINHYLHNHPYIADCPPYPFPPTPTPPDPVVGTRSILPATMPSAMIKKLSSTFRRKTSGNTPLHVTAPPTPTISDVSDPALAELTAAYNTVLSEQNRQVDELRRLRAMADAKVPRKARALTFSAGTDVESRRKKTSKSSREIPFFEPRDRNDRSTDRKKKAAVAVVKGSPASWRDENRPTVVPIRGPVHSDLAPPSAHTADEPQFMSQRCFSFDASHSVAIDAAPELSERRASTSLLFPESPVSDLKSRPLSNAHSGRRWPFPPSEDPEHPQLFAPSDDTMFQHISQRRDRVEARPLISACTFLENEVERMNDLLQSSDAECVGNADDNSAGDSPHRQFLQGSVERLTGILGILQDRYDCIEQYYIKSQEYAKAMGRFYQVTPTEYSKWVEDRALHHRKTVRKSMR